jgi:hypothetical protein
MHAFAWRENTYMSTLVLDVQDFGFIVGTRAALAAGIGLLASRSLSEERRRVIGTTLLAVGVVTTVPAVMSVVGGLRRARQQRRETGNGIEFDGRLIGATRFPRKGDDERS